MSPRTRKRWAAPMAFAAAVLLGVSSSMDALADGVMVKRARDQELQRQLLHASILMMLSRPHMRVRYTASGGGGGGASDTYRGVNLPRGITSANDVLLDASTYALTTRDGTGNFLWPWSAERYGAARHTAISGGNRHTVTTWAEFLTASSTFAAGSGDHEILVPASMTMTGPWTVPTGSGVTGRRLYVTYDGSLPTADTMPSLAAMGGCSVWSGVNSSQLNMILLDSNQTAELTLTGIVLRPTNAIDVAIVDIRNQSTPSTVADLPQKLVLDRCWLDGNGRSDVKRGIVANGRQLAFLETWITEIWSNGNESHAIVGWSGSQHIYHRNVLMEAVHIGEMWGGSSPAATGTGVFDPRDILCVNCASVKNSTWVASATTQRSQIKNCWEDKNVSRWMVFNSTSFKSYPGAQQHAVVIKNTQEPAEGNAAANASQDIVFLNHEQYECDAGALLIASRIANGGPALSNPSRRQVFDNWRLIRPGKTATTGTPNQLQGDFEDVVIDRWTYIDGYTNKFLFSMIIDGSDVMTRLTLTNFAFRWTVDGSGIAGVHWTVNGSGGTYGIAGFTAYAPSYTWAGHAAYSSITDQVSLNQPGLTHYQNASVATAASNMGFNTTTGAISGAASDDGVGGSTPGCDLTALDAGIASMASWAYSR